MFKLGDKVKFKKEHKEYLGHRWNEGAALVIGCLKDRHWSRQFCRITFDKGASVDDLLVNYDDVGAWLIERIE
jgi:hypothetical protein